MEPLSDTFFTAAPDWTWWVIPYFFIGGIAGGAFFIAALLDWAGEPMDRPVVRTGYVVGLIGAVVSGLLLVLDLGRPLRFWHMLFQSEEFPALAFKSWSPISFGAWGLMLFGLFAFLAVLSVLAVDGRLGWGPVKWLARRPVRLAIAALGGLFALFVAGYTGVLLSVSNRPIWADSNLIGMLFLASGASTAAATLVLLGRWRNVPDPSVQWLSRFDSWVLVFELLVLVAFVVSLGEVAKVWLSVWGLLLLVGVVFVGNLVPLALHYRPHWFRGRWAANHSVAAAALILVGGFLLRFVIILASENIVLFPFSESV